MPIHRNIEISRVVELAKQLIAEVFCEEGLTEAEQFRAYDKLWRAIPHEEIPTPPVQSKPMSYDEARRWYNNHRMEFGEHRGERIADVPEAYLVWLHNQPDFRRELDRFMRSELARGHFGRGEQEP